MTLELVIVVELRRETPRLPVGSVWLSIIERGQPGLES
jgi:hypothetical protein